MVKKYVFLLPAPGPEPEPDPGGQAGAGAAERSRLMAVNAELHRCLATCKNRISSPWGGGGGGGAYAFAGGGGGSAVRMWNTYKRHTNEYELIHTGSRALPGLSKHVPISRSFFKLWEMLADYGAREMALAGEAPATAAFLAEGPGGFVESFALWRNSTVGHAAASADTLHCITLVSPKRSVPCWKSSTLRRLSSDVRVHTGADGTGDLYRAANIRAFVEACGGVGSCALVTGDGGFDFSGDFNSQEDSSLRLVASQAYAALLLQAPGGSLVLKVFDAACAETMALLHGLHLSYAAVRLVKPLSSRPANSERYVLCTGFRSASPDLLAALSASLEQQSTAPLRALAAARPPPLPFVRAVVEYNAVHVARQASIITRTVAMIVAAGTGIIARGAGTAGGPRAGTAVEGSSSSSGANETTPPHAHSKQLLLHRQLCKSIRWCHKYRIPISTPVFQEYRQRLLKDDAVIVQPRH